MKKTLLIIAVAASVVVACKKDRVCNCKDYQTVNGAGATSVDYEYTMVKVGRKTAFNNCIHYKTTYTTTVFSGTTTATGTVEKDVNCELK